jgi:hypothetical protein
MLLKAVKRREKATLSASITADEKQLGLYKNEPNL